ncbi:MAG: ATPase, partial [Methanobacterium sp.]|nr:ATPase [Methanobacterium sp.]
MKLKVAEAFSQADVGRSIARIDPQCMEQLGLRDGDIIEIEGKKNTATVVASSQSDIRLGIIRIDGYIRKNAGTSIGEEVTVRRAKVKEAQKIVLAPVDQQIMIRGDIKGAFSGRVFTKGDIIVTGVRQPQTMGSGLFDEFFSETRSSFSPMGEIKLAVVSTKPAGVVKVTG